MEALIDTDAEAYRLAQALYNLRRKRDSALGPRRIFGEPAWDILLDLYIASKRGMEIQVSSVCIEAGVPSTTILRWIARLEKEGLLYRKADRGDARRRFVRLTDEGHAVMRRVLRAIGPIAYIRLESPYHPSTMKVTSMLTMSPSFSGRSPGMPWQTT